MPPVQAAAGRMGAWQCLVLAAALAALAICPQSSAYIVQKGKCPRYKGVPTDFDKLVGKRWYVLMSDPIQSLTGSLNLDKCESYIESYDPSTYEGRGTNHRRDFVTLKDDSFNYTFKFPNPPEGYYASVSTGPGNTNNVTSDSWIFEIDYENYLAIYTCGQVGEYSYGLAEIYGRCPQADPKFISKGLAALDRAGVNTKNMEYVMQTCGISGQSLCSSACECAKQDYYH